MASVDVSALASDATQLLLRAHGLTAAPPDRWGGELFFLRDSLQPSARHRGPQTCAEMKRLHDSGLLGPGPRDKCDEIRVWFTRDKSSRRVNIEAKCLKCMDTNMFRRH